MSSDEDFVMLKQPFQYWEHSRSGAFVRLTVVGLLVATGGFIGCAPPVVPVSEETLDVELPGRVVIAAAINSGPQALANTTWAIYRASNDEFLVRIQFGENGKIERFFDNLIYYPTFLGNEIISDNQSHPMLSPPGATYVAAAAGHSQGNDFGATLNMQSYLYGILVVTGNAKVKGTIDGDRFDGTFSYKSGVPSWFGTPSDEYLIYGLREQ